MVMSNLLTLIQIAKRDLAMEDDAYREMLHNLTGQRSCKALGHMQLKAVLDHMKALGFKPKQKPKPRAAEVTKIYAIWRTMYKQGFVRNGSDKAIDSYVRRMTTRMNGRGVERAIWLKSYQAADVLEAMKKWHYRLMADAIITKGGKVPQNRDGTGPCGYATLAELYEESYHGK